MNVQARIEALSKAPAGRFGPRLIGQLRYVYELSLLEKGLGEAELEASLAIAEEAIASDGALTDHAGKQAEQALLPLAARAKRDTVIYVGHAHIDMNWMWRYDETVSVTIDTFRTVLQLLREYPEFRFSQSQASVYEIVEHYHPEMLAEIRRYVEEGRWEVAAATWVEPDRNMPSAESVARHLLYTKRYLMGLFPTLTEADFALDFEPDAFGHSASIPHVLSQAGVKYYYHCRGDMNEDLIRWRSKEGGELLCYRDPFWYLGPIEYDSPLYAPRFCQRYGVDTFMRVYGVGDHGGGPTRRDIERVLEMAEWPVFATVRFGTYKEFYQKASHATNLPVVENELNNIFSGCYTSQARITQANRIGEAKLEEAEKFAAVSALTVGMQYPRAAFEGAWRKLLFSQFHDILPGSCVIDAREYAMGTFSELLAVAETQKSIALRTLTQQIDTAAFISAAGMEGTTSEGAGVGFGAGYGMSGLSPTLDAGGGLPFRAAQPERGRGINRVFHIFNPSAFARKEVVELAVFDWPGDYRRLKVTAAGGETLPHQLVDLNPQFYWHHHYVRVLVAVDLPAGGYRSIVLMQDDAKYVELELYEGIRLEKPFEYILENEYLRAQFCPDTGRLISLLDKCAGRELIGRPSAFFQLIQEQPTEDTVGTAWCLGRSRSIQDLTGDVAMRMSMKGALKNAVTITVKAESSTVCYTVSLAAGATQLEVHCDVDWREIGVPNVNTPQLRFTLPLALAQSAFVQDIPGTVLERSAAAQDVCCQSFASAAYESKAVMLISDSKYGFRCEREADGCVMSLTCLRSSSDPDPYPEFGRHQFRIGIGLASSAQVDLHSQSHRFCHVPMALSDVPREGTLPMQQAGIRVAGAHLQAVKLAEDADTLLLRLIGGGQAEIELPAQIVSAAFVDLHEKQAQTQQKITIAGKHLQAALLPGITTLAVTLKK